MSDWFRPLSVFDYFWYLYQHLMLLLYYVTSLFVLCGFMCFFENGFKAKNLHWKTFCVSFIEIIYKTNKFCINIPAFNAIKIL